ncbi:hypothetical protein ACH5RR_024809 [Cinchona calisaya]|uniref:Uncharacterized protein n=1 Tax=Cinchona calisaya TaxID=153742 RepID=A0ABD2Z104_9GENT
MFKQSLRSPGALLAEFWEGDPKAFVAYLKVLQKVAFHNTIATFAKVGNSVQPMSTQPLDVKFSQDHNQTVDQYSIQQCSIKIFEYSKTLASRDSSRMVDLVQLLLKSSAAGPLIEDYATCLELRSVRGSLGLFRTVVKILVFTYCKLVPDLLLSPAVLLLGSFPCFIVITLDNNTLGVADNNISRPAPHIAHLLQAAACFLKVILDVLEKLSKPDVNALLHNFGFQHLDTFSVVRLPKRNNNQALRISSLHQSLEGAKQSNNVLVNSMTNDIGENFLLYDTTQEIWEAAKELYSNKENTSEIFEIESVLHDLWQGELNVTQYYGILTRYWQRLDVFEEYH